ncbi:MAG: cobalamin B12-binding domain-containing protein [Acidobacteria bacterium]|nr:cobalamin B12-binding domain-containing protein [Acidobacteriota bacterium]
MRVLLVYANRSRLHVPPPPIGLAYVAAATERAGHAVRLVDLYPARDPAATLRREVRAFAPDLVGVSVRNIDSASAQLVGSQLDEAAGFVAAVRAETDARVVVGGPAVSILGPAALRHLGADLAVLGEGEVAFPDLLAALAAGRDPLSVPGVVSRSGGAARATAPARLASFGPSTLAGRIDWRPYARAGATWPIQGKRGCPLLCAHCVYSVVEGCAVRARPADEVVEEIAEVAATVGPRCFEIVDSSFNVPLEPAVLLCEAILRRGLEVTLTSTAVNPLTASPELFALMKRAGFNSMMLSPESACDATLASLQKGFTAEHVARTAEAARGAGIPSNWFFLLGGPDETEATAEETVSFIERRIDWPGSAAVVATGVRVLPGSAVARRAVAEGVVAPDDDLARPTFYLSPAVTEAWLVARVNRAVLARPNVVHTAEQGGRTEGALTRVLAGLGVAPRHWRFLPRLVGFPPLLAWRRRQARKNPTRPPGQESRV